MDEEVLPGNSVSQPTKVMFDNWFFSSRRREQRFSRINDEVSATDFTTPLSLSTSTSEQTAGLSTYMGVFQPCMLSIFGAVLFLRLSWSCSQVGWLMTCCMLFIASTTVTFTTLSIAAISTNGKMKGGGAYFMASRSLGPELGGAVGVIFFLANALGTTFYLIAFAEGLYGAYSDNLNESKTGLSQQWMQVCIATFTHFLLVFVALRGAKFVVKLYSIIFVILILSILAIFTSLLFESSNALDFGGFEGFSFKLMEENAFLTPTRKGGYSEVFLVIFPAVTGIMAGANFSGELADPGSIGYGTLAAIAVALSVYAALALTVGATIHMESLRANEQIAYTLVQELCFSRGLVLLGIVASTVSSALGALVGGSQVLQALANDELIPILSPLVNDKGESKITILVTAAFAQVALLLGSFDLIAIVITQSFLLVYVLLNFSCFIMSYTGAPNFRPRFKYFSKFTALAGLLSSGLIMFLSSAATAFLSIIGVVVLSFCIHLFGKDVPWGNISQALIFHSARKFLLRLQMPADPRFWRPSILLVVGNTEIESPNKLLPILEICNTLKKGGLCVIGSVINGSLRKCGTICRRMNSNWSQLVDAAGIKAFSEVIFSETGGARSGIQHLMITTGIGGLKPNTVCMPVSFLNQEKVNNRNENKIETKSDTGVPENTSVPVRRDNHHNHYTEFERVINKNKAFTKMSKALANLQREIPKSGLASPKNPVEFHGIMSDVLSLNLNLILCNNCELLHNNYSSTHEIDVWQMNGRNTGFSPRAKLSKSLESKSKHCLSRSGTLSLQLQLAHIIARTTERSRVRFLSIVANPDEINSTESAMKNVLNELRMDATVKCIPLTPCHDLNAEEARRTAIALQNGEELNLSAVKCINHIIAQESASSRVTLMALPMDVEQEDMEYTKAALFVEKIRCLSENLGATIFVATSLQRSKLISMEL
eukprot:g4841.t1